LSFYLCSDSFFLLNAEAFLLSCKFISQALSFYLSSDSFFLCDSSSFGLLFKS